MVKCYPNVSKTELWQTWLGGFLFVFIGFRLGRFSNFSFFHTIQIIPHFIKSVQDNFIQLNHSYPSILIKMKENYQIMSLSWNFTPGSDSLDVKSYYCKVLKSWNELYSTDKGDFFSLCVIWQVVNFVWVFLCSKSHIRCTKSKSLFDVTRKTSLFSDPQFSLWNELIDIFKTIQWKIAHDENFILLVDYNFLNVGFFAHMVLKFDWKWRNLSEEKLNFIFVD